LTKTYYIFRHGATYATKAGIDYTRENPDPPILDEGVVAIKKAAKYLKNMNTGLNLTSKYLRCRMTADIISDITGKKFDTELLLNEALLVGIEFKNETLEEFLDRMRRLHLKLISTAANNILLITHGAVIGCLKHLLVKGKVEEQNIYDYPEPGILTVIKGGSVKEINFN
jgi:broad specificity phosphatase PhoE